MIFVVIDLESNGPDPELCAVTEFGWVIRDTEVAKPLSTKAHMLLGVKDMDPEAGRITKISLELLERCGITREEVLDDFRKDVERHKPEYIVAHNWHRFDGPLLNRFIRVDGKPIVELPPAIDTLEDLPDESYEFYRNRTLVDMCTDREFLNPFPHAALFDCMALDKLLKYEDMEKVAARSRVPSVTVFADVSFQNKDLAKERGYYWQNLRGVVYPKKWVKRMKKDMVPLEQENCPFNVGIIE